MPNLDHGRIGLKTVDAVSTLTTVEAPHPFSRCLIERDTSVFGISPQAHLENSLAGQAPRVGYGSRFDRCRDPPRRQSQRLPTADNWRTCSRLVLRFLSVASVSR